jgi:hypothetical protein
MEISAEYVRDAQRGARGPVIPSFHGSRGPGNFSPVDPQAILSVWVNRADGQTERAADIGVLPMPLIHLPEGPDA